MQNGTKTQLERLADLLGPDGSELRDSFWQLRPIHDTARRYALDLKLEKVDALRTMAEQIGRMMSGEEIGAAWREIEEMRDEFRAETIDREEAMRRLVIALCRQVRRRSETLFFNGRLGEPWQADVQLSPNRRTYNEEQNERLQ